LFLLRTTAAHKYHLQVFALNVGSLELHQAQCGRRCCRRWRGRSSRPARSPAPMSD